MEIYILSKESISYISEDGTLQFLIQALKIKELHPGKIYDTSGNEKPQKILTYQEMETLKSFLYFRR